MKNFTLKALCLLALLCMFTSAQIVKGQVQTAKSISMTGNSRGFYEYLPEGYQSEAQSYPLLVFIHGLGELGDGSQGSLPAILQNGPPKLISQGSFPSSFTIKGQTFKFIVISPQFVYWPGPNDVQEVINYCVKNYRVDANRIYLSGLSMGGGATWEYASNSYAFANRLAAIVPVCGSLGPDMPRAQTMASANLPVWALHNDADPTVSPYFTNTWVDWMNASTPQPGPLARKTMFSAYWHDAWSVAYDPNYRENNMNVYEWMLQYQRGTTVPTQPVPVNAVSIPGKIEAENYSGMNGINTEYTYDGGGGRNVGWIDNGDWMDYSINVATAGTYNINFRVASPNAGQQFQVKRSDGTVLSTVNIPQTGGFQNWSTVSTSIALAAGTQTLRYASLQSGWNLNWAEYSEAPATPGGTATIEAENYSAMNGVGTEGTADAGGGKNVGWIDGGDWMDYTINAPSAGTYRVNFRVGTINDGAQFQFRQSDGSVLANVSVPKTGSFQVFTTTSVDVALKSGTQTVRIYSLQNNWNFNWMKIEGITTGAAPGKMEAENFKDMSGIQVENTSDAGGGQNVGWIDNTDWMDYTVNITAAGVYTLSFRVASPNAGSQFQVNNVDGQVLATVTVPQTGGYQNWANVSAYIWLPAVEQKLRIKSLTSNWNINWIDISRSGSSAASAAEPVSTQSATTRPEAFIASGKLEANKSSIEIFPNPVTDKFVLKTNSRFTGPMAVQIIDQSGTIRKKFMLSKTLENSQDLVPANGLSSGTYFIRIQMGEQTIVKKMIKL